MARTIRHGSDLLAADVGPAAIAAAATARHDGGSIREDRLPPFVIRREASAVYDGQRVAGPHLLVEGVHFTGPVEVATRRPIVFRGVTIAPEASAHAALRTTPDSGPLLLTHCRIEGVNGARVGVAAMLRAPQAHMHRSHLLRVSDAIHPTARAIRITETLIDGLETHPGDHNDAVQLGPRSGAITIARSKIHNPHPQTSCLYLMGDTIDVLACHLAGGGWTVYGGAAGNGKALPDARAVRVVDCVFGRQYFPRCGHFGPLTYWKRAPALGNVFQNNRFDDGTPVITPS